MRLETMCLSMLHISWTCLLQSSTINQLRVSRVLVPYKNRALVTLRVPLLGLVVFQLRSSLLSLAIAFVPLSSLSTMRTAEKSKADRISLVWIPPTLESCSSITAHLARFLFFTCVGHPDNWLYDVTGCQVSPSCYSTQTLTTYATAANGPWSLRSPGISSVLMRNQSIIFPVQNRCNFNSLPFALA
ncbi:hypothetical protein F4803DRAFT_503462 [Xylaria telfairii]|nr:hypothetical protein F4803DRAFT_503462 [Xylaria telfairii]